MSKRCGRCGHKKKKHHQGRICVKWGTSRRGVEFCDCPGYQKDK